MIPGYRVVQHLPQTFNVIHTPPLVHGLVNPLIFWVLFQPFQGLLAFMDDAVTHNERDRFIPLVHRLQVFQKTDK